MLIYRSFSSKIFANVLQRTYKNGGIKINEVLNNKYHITSKIVCDSRPIFLISSEICKRTYSEGPRKYLNREDKLKLGDKIDMDWNLIYNAPMSKYLSFAQNFSTFSFITISAITLPQLVNGNSFLNMPIESGTTLAASGSEYDAVFLLIGFLIANIGIRWLASQYAIRLYNKDKNYIAIFNGQLPTQIKKLEFIQGDIVPVQSSVLIPWGEGKFKAGGKGVILLENFFKSPSHMNAMFQKT